MTSTARLLRGLLAASVLLSAVVHLDLWADEGFRDIPGIGPAFLLNAVAGLLIGLAVLTLPGRLPLLAAAAFGAATLGAFVVSATVGLLGVHETWSGAPQVLAAVSEAGALVLAAAVALVERVERGGSVAPGPTRSAGRGPGLTTRGGRARER